MPTKQFGTRTFLELSVGGTHSIEVILHLRRVDIKWWNSDSSRHQRQLFRLLGRRVLPAECSEEIEQYHHKKKRKRERPGVDAGKKSVVIGEKNLKKASAAAGVSGTGGKVKPDKKQNQKAGAQSTDQNKDPAVGSTTEIGGGQDVSYLFGDTIQATYRVEDIDTTESATLIYEDDGGDEACDTESNSAKDGTDTVTSTLKSRKNKATADGSSAKRKLPLTKIATFRQLVKLPKRIIIWCYPFDPANPTEPITEGGGFPRPELIPITSLFHGED